MEVSVVIPVFNVERYLEHAVQSALAQPETRQVVLVEDASTDRSLELCCRIADGDSRVQVVRHPGGANRGAAESRNLGVSQVRCEFTAFLDADDYYLPGRFRVAGKIIDTDPSIDGVYEAVGLVADDEATRRWYLSTIGPEVLTLNRVPDPDRLFEALLDGTHGYFCTDGIVVRTSLLHRAGLFDTSLLLAEDTAMWLKLAALGRLAAGSLEQPVSMRRLHGGNTSYRHRQSNHAYANRMFRSMLNWARREGLPRSRRLLLLDVLLNFSLRDLPTSGPYLPQTEDTVAAGRDRHPHAAGVAKRQVSRPGRTDRGGPPPGPAAQVEPACPWPVSKSRSLPSAWPLHSNPPANCGVTASCSTSSCGATSRSATSSRCSAGSGPSSSRSARCWCSRCSSTSWPASPATTCRTRSSPTPPCCRGPTSRRSITQIGNSLVTNQHLITKVYFPRVAIPTASAIRGLVDFGIADGPALRHDGVLPVLPELGPVAVAAAARSRSLVLTLGVGMFFAALNVRYRDVQHVLPFLVQLWLFVTPIIYPVDLVPSRWRTLLALNPLTGLVEAFRACVLPEPAPGFRHVRDFSCCMTAAIFIGSVLYFRHTAREFRRHRLIRHHRPLDAIMPVALTTDRISKEYRLGELHRASSLREAISTFGKSLVSRGPRHPREDHLGLQGRVVGGQAVARWSGSSAATEPARARC